MIYEYKLDPQLPFRPPPGRKNLLGMCSKRRDPLVRGSILSYKWVETPVYDIYIRGSRH